MASRATIQKSRPRTDILVVGAGPAGISAALALARAGARVMLIDRDEAPGRKACAGGLTEEAWRRAGLDPLSPPPFAETFDALAVHTVLGRLVLRGERAKPVLMTVDRRRFQGRLLDDAAALGVTVRLKERLMCVDGPVARTDKESIRFDRMVAADGAASRVRRSLGLCRGAAIKALQLRVPSRVSRPAAVEDRAPAVWFAPLRMATGYGWCFPFGGELRLGLGLPAKATETRRKREIFEQWLSEIGVAGGRTRIEAGTVPCEYAGHRFGRIFLAGDAAGLASPLTGEGIYQAIVSGEEVAREITDTTYRSRVIPELAQRHRRTADALSAPGLKHLLTTAPWALRIPVLRRTALRRYAGVLR